MTTKAKTAKATAATATTAAATATTAAATATTAAATATTAATETAVVTKVRVRNLLRDKIAAHVANGDYGNEGQHSTAVRKQCLQFVVDCGGAKNSGPAEYNTVMLELIDAEVVRKVTRGVYVAVTKQ